MAQPAKIQPEAESQQNAEVSDLLALGANPTRESVGGKRYIQEAPTSAAAPPLLRHWPANWEVAEVDGAPVWLPEISIHPVVPGANGIRTTNQGEGPEAAWVDAQIAARKKGWIYVDTDTAVPANCLPAGVPPGALPVRTYEVRDPESGAIGKTWVEVWKIPMPTIPGERQRWKFDRAAYNRWRLHLVESGQIQPPLEHVIERRKANAADRVARVPVHVGDDVRKRLLEPRVEAADKAEKARTPRKKAAA